MHEANSNMKDNTDSEKDHSCCTPRCALPRLGSYLQCSYRCWQFIVSVMFSMFGLVVGFIGLMGAFETYDQTFYSNLITFILGVWLPSPRLKEERLATTLPQSLRATSKLRDDEEEELEQTESYNNKSHETGLTARSRRTNKEFIGISI